MSALQPLFFIFMFFPFCFKDSRSSLSSKQRQIFFAHVVFVSEAENVILKAAVVQAILWPGAAHIAHFAPQSMQLLIAGQSKFLYAPRRGMFSEMVLVFKVIRCPFCCFFLAAISRIFLQCPDI